MAKKNRECVTCGEKYYYCPNCNRKAPAWMSEFHEANCKNIFQICTSFNVNVMSKHEAQEALKACDLSNKLNFTSMIKHDLENIFNEDEESELNCGECVETQPVDETDVHEVVE